MNQNHMPNNAEFDFHKYIRRSLQDDFKYVVGISPGLWGYTLVWLLLNVDGWESNIVITAIPLILVLAIGTKLQHIMTKMAVHFNNKHPLTIGMPMVQPNDNLFWFNRPRFILLCIHYILFQNALEISFDLWAAVTFSPDNCIYRQPSFLIGRIVIGLVVQMTCGIITLPIYALVSQMGSNVKKTIFKEHIQKAIRNWHKRAKERIIAKERGEGSSTIRSPLAALASAEHIQKAITNWHERAKERIRTAEERGEGGSTIRYPRAAPASAGDWASSSSPPGGHTSVEMVLHAFPDV